MGHSLRLLLVSSALVLAACGPGETPLPTTKASETAAEADARVAAYEAARLKAVAEYGGGGPVMAAVSPDLAGRVCRATIAALMGRDPGIIRVTSNTPKHTDVRYTRDDGKAWQQRCRVEPGRVVWAGIDEAGRVGRWRDEDQITYNVEGDKVSVRISMDGELVNDETYTIQ